jgi:hypothetical protein
MYKKTLGLFVIALMAISVTGVVYANLCVDFTFTHNINTGTVKIGIRNDGTSDPRGTNDLVWDGNAFVRTHKDIANTTSDNIGPVKCIVNDVNYYGRVFFNITDAYPWYVAYENMSIVNCGTIPVFITNLELNQTASSDPFNIQGHVQIWGYVTDAQGVQSGQLTIAQIADLLPTLQIDSGQTVQISMWILFLQDVPLNAKATFEVSITACQWNEVLWNND